MERDQAMRVQMQLRHNAEDLQSYLRELESWEEEMKLKDESLSKKKPILKEVGGAIGHVSMSLCTRTAEISF